MTLNVGLLLRKPGESPYARYRRFLIANNSIAFIKIRAELEKYYCRGDIKISRACSGPYNPAECAAELEEQFIQRYALKRQSCTKLLKQYHPKQCCNSCAAIGFHCELFDLPGFDICPIHGERLTERCGECGLRWPTAYQLVARNCIKCGTRATVQDLLNAGLENTSSYYQKIAVTQSLLDFGYQQFTQNFYLKYRDCRIERYRPLTNHLSPFHVCVVSNIAYQGAPYIADVCESLIKMFDVEKKTFRIKKTTVSMKNQRLNAHNSLQSKIIMKTTEKLEKLFNTETHVLGACEAFDTPGEGCLSCTVYAAWKSVVGYGDVLAFHSAEEHQRSLATNRLFLKKPFAPSFNTTLLVTEANDCSYYIKIPRALSILLYEHDLWTTAVHLYEYFSALTRSDRISWLDIKRMEKPLISPDKTYYCPYVMKLGGNELDVYFPNDIFTNELKLNKSVAKLLA